MIEGGLSCPSSLSAVLCRSRICDAILLHRDSDVLYARVGRSITHQSLWPEISQLSPIVVSSFVMTFFLPKGSLIYKASRLGWHLHHEQSLLPERVPFPAAFACRKLGAYRRV